MVSIFKKLFPFAIGCYKEQVTVVTSVEVRVVEDRERGEVTYLPPRSPTTLAPDSSSLYLRGNSLAPYNSCIVYWSYGYLCFFGQYAKTEPNKCNKTQTKHARYSHPDPKLTYIPYSTYWVSLCFKYTREIIQAKNYLQKCE